MGVKNSRKGRRVSSLFNAIIWFIFPFMHFSLHFLVSVVIFLTILLLNSVILLRVLVMEYFLINA